MENNKKLEQTRELISDIISGALPNTKSMLKFCSSNRFQTMLNQIIKLIKET